MKYFSIGTIVAALSIIISLIMKDIYFAVSITSGIGLLLLFVALLLSGVFVSGDRMRANQASETKEARIERNNVALNSILIAIPNFAVAIILNYFLS